MPSSRPLPIVMRFVSSIKPMQEGDRRSPSWTSTLDVAEQTWPWFQKIPNMIHSTAFSMSAVFEDHERGLAAELEADALYVSGRRRHDPGTDRARTGECELVDALMIDERLTGNRAVAR